MEEKILFLISNLLTFVVVILKIFLCSYLLNRKNTEHVITMTSFTQSYNDLTHLPLIY